jgi:hypothetical protein
MVVVLFVSSCRAAAWRRRAGLPDGYVIRRGTDFNRFDLR